MPAPSHILIQDEEGHRLTEEMFSLVYPQLFNLYSLQSLYKQVLCSSLQVQTCVLAFGIQSDTYTHAAGK
jgi:hypothetical protein